MKKFAALAFVAALVAASSFQVLAQSKAMHSKMMANGPKCAAGDTVVGVNTATKMYMTHDQMKMKAKGMTDAQIEAMMTKNHVKMMCLSAATKMGAKPMSNKM